MRPREVRWSPVKPVIFPTRFYLKIIEEWVPLSLRQPVLSLDSSDLAKNWSSICVSLEDPIKMRSLWISGTFFVTALNWLFKICMRFHMFLWSGITSWCPETFFVFYCFILFFSLRKGKKKLLWIFFQWPFSYGNFWKKVWVSGKKMYRIWCQETWVHRSMELEKEGTLKVIQTNLLVFQMMLRSVKRVAHGYAASK